MNGHMVGKGERRGGGINPVPEGTPVIFYMQVHLWILHGKITKILNFNL